MLELVTQCAQNAGPDVRCGTYKEMFTRERIGLQEGREAQAALPGVAPPTRRHSVAPGAVASAHARLDVIHGECLRLESLAAVHAVVVVACEDLLTSQ